MTADRPEDLAAVAAARPLDGEVVLVTGAAERAGARIATGFALAGARVVVNHLPSQAGSAGAVVAEIERLGGTAVAIAADITDPVASSVLVADTVAAFGQLDVLLHNASSFAPRPFLDVRPEDWDASLGVNLRGPFFLTQAAARVMLDQSTGGQVVALVGNSLVEAWPDFVPHAVGKSALARLVEQLAVALAPTVQCNAVAPSQFYGSDDGANDALRTSRGEATPSGALFRHPSGAVFPEATVADVLAVLLDLVRAPRSLSGTVLRVDGGRALA